MYGNRVNRAQRNMLYMKMIFALKRAYYTYARQKTLYPRDLFVFEYKIIPLILSAEGL